MKTLKITTILLMLIIGMGTQSCRKYVKKEDMKIENIDVTIQPYQWNWNSMYKRWEYSVGHEFIHNDALVGYVMDGGDQAMPYYDASKGITYGLIDETYSDRIIVTYYDGSENLDHPEYATYVYLKIIPSPE